MNYDAPHKGKAGIHPASPLGFAVFHRDMQKQLPITMPLTPRYSKN